MELVFAKKVILVIAVRKKNPQIQKNLSLD